MKARTFKRPEDLIDYLYEKFFKWKEVLTDLLRTKDKSSTHINELYSIKQEYMKAEFVNSFLKERIRLAGMNRYRISIDYAYSSEREKEIGNVRLICRGREIDRATLITGPETGNGDRLIFWSFTRKANTRI